MNIGNIDSPRPLTVWRKGAPSATTGVSYDVVRSEQVALAADNLDCANFSETMEQAFRIVPGVTAVTGPSLGRSALTAVSARR